MFRLKISWGLAVCLTLFVAGAGNAAPLTGGLPAPRGEASWLDLETLWARAWSWLARGVAATPSSPAVPKHGSVIDPNGDPKHGLIIDPDGDPRATAGAWSEHGALIDLDGSN
jgi:hypothetical protein